MAKGNHGIQTNKDKYNKAKDKPLAARDARVSKSSQSTKAQSKNLAKAVAAKIEIGKKSKDSKKARIPSPSESEAESEESDDSDESEESEDEKKPETSKAVKANGVSHPLEDSGSEESDDSESDEDAADSRVNGVSAKAKDDEDDDDDDDESSDSDKSGDEEKPFQPDSSAAEGAGSDSSSSSEDSEDDEEDEEEEEEKAAPSKKRKAEPESPAEAKKPKAEAPAANTDSLPTKNLFIGRLSFNVDDEWLKREFDEFGEVTRAVVMTRPDGKSKGFGYVEFDDVEAAKAALAAKHGTEIDGREINVDYAGAPKQDRPPRAERFADQINPPSQNLFIGNLSFDIENNDIAEHFGQYGTVTRVSIPTDRETGQPKGFGYVEFESTEEAQAAFEGSSGQYLKGRAMRLDYAATGPKNAGQGGRGGFSGGRGGGGRGGFRGGRGGGDRGGFRGGFRGGRGGGDRGGFRGGRGGGGGGYQGKRTTFD